MDLWNAILQNPEACILKVLFAQSKIIFEIFKLYTLPRLCILSLHLLFNIILIHYTLDNSTDCGVQKI